MCVKYKKPCGQINLPHGFNISLDNMMLFRENIVRYELINN